MLANILKYAYLVTLLFIFPVHASDRVDSFDLLDERASEAVPHHIDPLIWNAITSNNMIFSVATGRQVNISAFSCPAGPCSSHYDCASGCVCENTRCVEDSSKNQN